MKSLLGTTAILLLSAIPAMAGGTDVESFPLSFTVDSCDGATVSVSGEAQFASHYVVDNANGEHINFTATIKGVKGTDSFGRSYVAVNTAIATYEFNRGAYNQSGPFMFMLISQGGTPNLSISGNFHETITPEGKLTAYVDEFKSVCR